MAGSLLACGGGIIPGSYRVELPDLPQAWADTLGESSWLVEWVDGDGQWRKTERDSQAVLGLRLELARQWTTPVLAYPCWPGRVEAGLFRPAGALAPFDADGDRIRLSWAGGVDAQFYKELSGIAHDTRRAEYFDWPRFRELFSSGVLQAEAAKDPWLVDWRELAVRTAASGFDRRRIVSAYKNSLVLSLPEPGPWFGSSPFGDYSFMEYGKSLTLGLASRMDTYICPSGILRCSPEALGWFPFNAGR